MILTANQSASATTAGAAAVEIALDMSERRQWRITAKGSLWFRVVAPGDPGAAIAGAGSHYLADGRTFEVARLTAVNASSQARSRISIIRDGATDVTGILSEVAPVQTL
jgi:hypothetical protein